MKRSMNFGGSARTQQKRATPSATADVFQMFFTPVEIEQMRKEHDAFNYAIDDCLKYSGIHGCLSAGVMFRIAYANNVDAKRLMLALEKQGLCLPGATIRFENLIYESGHTWQKLTEHFTR